MTTEQDTLSPEAAEAPAGKPAQKLLNAGRASVMNLDDIAEDIADVLLQRRRGHAVEVIVPERFVSALTSVPESTTTLAVARTRSGLFFAIATLAVAGMRLALAVAASGAGRDWLMETLQDARLSVLLNIDGTSQACIVDSACALQNVERVVHELEAAPTPTSREDVFELAEAMSNCVVALELCEDDATYLRFALPDIEFTMH